jgi:hypothetical protein
MLFMAKLFSSRHKVTKTLRKNNKKYLSCLDGKYLLVPGWVIIIYFFQMKNLKKS